MPKMNGRYDGDDIRGITADGREVRADDEWFEDTLRQWEHDGIDADLIHMARPLLEGTAKQQRAAERFLSKVRDSYMDDATAQSGRLRLLRNEGAAMGRVPPHDRGAVQLSLGRPRREAAGQQPGEHLVRSQRRHPPRGQPARTGVVMAVNYLTMTKDDRDLGDSDATFVWPLVQPRGTTVDSVKVSRQPSDLTQLSRLDDAPCSDDGSLPHAVIAPPTGFFRSVFRAVRDPSVAGDDSGDPLPTQIYNHGWVLAVRLASYFDDLDEVWPFNAYRVVPITGTSAVQAAAGFRGESGYFGFEQVVWAGTGAWGSIEAGEGQVRQVVSGGEASTRQVATILDRLKAASTASRNAIKDVTWGAAAVTAIAHGAQAANLRAVGSGTVGGITDGHRFAAGGRW